MLYLCFIKIQTDITFIVGNHHLSNMLLSITDLEQLIVN